MNPPFPPRPTHLAWTLLREVIRPGDLVIDATAGNGHDTVFLAECVGQTGKVLAFDVQAEAIHATSEKVSSLDLAHRVTLHQICHTRMEEFVAPESATAVMFNLGYLPGQDHALTTTAAQTIEALEAATRVLGPGGILSILCYPGHPEGATEADRVETWVTSLTDHGWRVAKYAMIGTKKPAPFLVAGRKP